MKTRSGQPATTSTKVKGTVATPVRGKPKSGRIDKTPRERATSMIKTKSKPGKQGSAKLREEQSRVKSMAANLKEEINGAHQAKKEREAANRLRKAEQAKKAEVVQTVRNASKIKRTKKKALRKSNAAATKGKANNSAEAKRVTRSSL